MRKGLKHLIFFSSFSGGLRSWGLKKEEKIKERLINPDRNFRVYLIK